MNKKTRNIINLSIIAVTICSIVGSKPAFATTAPHKAGDDYTQAVADSQTDYNGVTVDENGIKRSENSWGSSDDIANNIQPYYMTKAEWEQYKKDGPINKSEGTNGFNPLAKSLRIAINKANGEPVDLKWQEYKKIIGLKPEDGDYIALSKRFKISEWIFEIRAYDKSGNLKTSSEWKDSVGILFRQWDTPVEPKYGWNEFVYGSWCYYDGNNWLTSTWKYIDGNWYYFNDHSHMVEGFQTINGSTYSFGGNGAMMIGWCKVGAFWYYFNSDGTMATNTTIDGYKLGANGRLVE